jgi:hypothetical protein
MVVAPPVYLGAHVTEVEVVVDNVVEEEVLMDVLVEDVVVNLEEELDVLEVEAGLLNKKRELQYY